MSDKVKSKKTKKEKPLICDKSKRILDIFTTCPKCQRFGTLLKEDK